MIATLTRPPAHHLSLQHMHSHCMHMCTYTHTHIHTHYLRTPHNALGLCSTHVHTHYLRTPHNALGLCIFVWKEMLLSHSFASGRNRMLRRRLCCASMGRGGRWHVLCLALWGTGMFYTVGIWLYWRQRFLAFVKE